MTHKQRVNAAISHKSCDRLPRDFAAEPLVLKRLLESINARNKEELLRHFDIDCRVVSYDDKSFIKKGIPVIDNGTIDVWGAVRKRVDNQHGSYEELCEYPLEHCQTLADLKQYPWASPLDWDFSRLNQVIDDINEDDQYHLRFRVGSIFETAWSLRGFEQFLIDMLTEPQLAHYMLDRVTEVHVENLKRVLSIAKDRIDMVYIYDDIAHQTGMLMSEEVWKEMIGKRQKQIIDIAKSHGKWVMYHTCGAVSSIIPRLIEIGVDVLNPIQPRASQMDLDWLKKEFGRDITFHGAIDIQEILPRGTADEVREEVKRVVSILSEGGGYILAPAHHIQNDTPVDNVFALYGV